MLVEIGAEAEALVAFSAVVWPFTSMDNAVPVKGGGLAEALATVSAGVGLLTSVSEAVLGE